MRKNIISLAAVKKLADIIYAEASNDTDKVKYMIGSTVINRLNSKHKEFGQGLSGIIQGYAGANTQKYMKARMYDFLAHEKEVYRECFLLSRDLLMGHRSPRKGIFYFTPQEESVLRNESRFSFDKVNFVDRVGNYNVYSY